MVSPTLAEAIARKRGLHVVHLDLLYHLPNTDWEVRPTDEFVALHDAAITEERWVMDGITQYVLLPAENYLIVKESARWKEAEIASNEI